MNVGNLSAANKVLGGDMKLFESAKSGLNGGDSALTRSEGGRFSMVVIGDDFLREGEAERDA